MGHLVDATGRRHFVNEPPGRIVSLVPSTTETVFALGASNELVGITRFCVRPPEAREHLPIVGGTKSPKIDRIRELAPDLILANREENRREDIEALRTLISVYVAFPTDLESAIAEIRNLGALLGRRGPADELARDLEEQRQALTRATTTRSRFRYLYLIWRNPYMAAGTGTFVDGFLRDAGGDNRAPAGARYPQMSVAEIASAGADVVFLSSEPFPFTGEHAEELRGVIADAGASPPRLLLVDGQLLCWHGARLQDGIPYLTELAAGLSDERSE